MFNEVLKAQWRWTWAPLLFAAVAAFSIPILSLQNARMLDESGDIIRPDYVIEHFLLSVERWSPLYTLLAAAVGLLLGTLAWTADHRGRHVYSLTLPVERWRLVLMRFGSGASLLLIPVLTLLIGGVLAVTTAAIPDGLVAYPVALAFRFGLAALVAFALFFAISAGTTRTAALVLAPLGVLIVADVVMSATGNPMNVTTMVLDALFTAPGIFEVFTGRWLLVDV